MTSTFYKEYLEGEYDQFALEEPDRVDVDHAVDHLLGVVEDMKGKTISPKMFSHLEELHFALGASTKWLQKLEVSCDA